MKTEQKETNSLYNGVDEKLINDVKKTWKKWYVLWGEYIKELEESGVYLKKEFIQQMKERRNLLWTEECENMTVANQAQTTKNMEDGDRWPYDIFRELQDHVRAIDNFFNEDEYKYLIVNDGTYSCVCGKRELKRELVYWFMEGDKSIRVYQKVGKNKMKVKELKYKVNINVTVGNK